MATEREMIEEILQRDGIPTLDDFKDIKNKYLLTRLIMELDDCTDNEEKKWLDLIFEIINRKSGYNEIDIYAYKGKLLSFASRNGDIEKVKYLLERNVHINAEGGLPLIFAYRKKQMEMIKYLIEQGANPCCDKCIIFRILYDDKDPEMIDYIIKIRNGNLNVLDLFRENRYDIMKYLINNGLNVNFEDYLLKAIELNKPELVKLLIEKGAEHSGQKYIKLAKKLNQKEIIEILQRDNTILIINLLEKFNKLVKDHLDLMQFSRNVPNSMEEIRKGIDVINNFIEDLKNKQEIDYAKVLERI